ncbi:MAG TPA: riboflavin synthase [Nitrospiria bacterium]|nr:riboflavin synthase [Nitrospiria bacterium]HUK56470.1 riboflavin synthase [Nitrospiria bacterium]
MFTGIIEEMGVVRAFNRDKKSGRLSILAKAVLEDLALGDSVTVNGVCLTVTEKSEGEFSADVSPETLLITNMDSLNVGDAVNLERAVRVNSRLGGHLVTGHIDGVGRIRDRRQEDEAIFFTIEIPKDLLRYCVRKGSIAVDGISLTINQVSDRDIQVAIIPHTAKATTLGLKGVNGRVNIECDLIGKYLERLLQERGSEESPQKVDRDYLRRRGLL